MPSTAPSPTLPGPTDWQHRLGLVVDMMREMSRHTDPQAMVHAYAGRAKGLLGFDRLVAVSRRGLSAPGYRITRSSTWSQEINPWRERDRLPILRGGLLGELIYGDEPRVIDDLAAHVDPADPAYEYLQGQRSLVAIPQYDDGVALNMVLMMRPEPHAFSRDEFPQMVWMGNLFGRATYNLVLSAELRAAYEKLDHELKTVGAIQRALLPTELPTIPGVELAAHYQTSLRAGGDYYDFFPLLGGRWGILIADVSGHGTPAAVMMAITHSIAHAHPGPPDPPAGLLRYLNRQLAAQYLNGHTIAGNFVTAFYGIYDPATRRLHYSSAGHNPPRLRRADGTMAWLDCARQLPLGVEHDEGYDESEIGFSPGDTLVLYTDGITEARNPTGELFGNARLDGAIASCASARETLRCVLEGVERFADGRPADDDRTLLVARIV